MEARHCTQTPALSQCKDQAIYLMSEINAVYRCTGLLQPDFDVGDRTVHALGKRLDKAAFEAGI